MVKFKLPQWFIRVSRHEKCLSEMEMDVRTHYEAEMIAVINDFEKRKSHLRLQINVLKSFASNPNLVVTANILETLEERQVQIQELKGYVRTLEKYISDQSYDKDSMPVAGHKIVDN
jgi:hypothetical protein